MLIARDSKLVYAYTMGNFSDADPQPPQAIHPVLFWKVPARADFVRSEHLVGTTITAYTCTQGTANYVRTGFDSQSASGSYAGCSASFEREHKERVARSSLDKTLQMIGSWYNPRATLTLDECTAVSPYFVDAVEKAVASATPTRDLQAVFDEYGIAVPRQVTLGGQLYFVHAQDVHVQVDEKSVQETISAAVSVEVGGAKGTVSASFQTATSEKVTAQSIHDSSTFIACGGKVTLRTNPDKWLDTVNKASLWAVIGRAGLRSVLDLLEPDQPDLRKRALKVWDKMPPAIGAIGDLPVQNQTLPEPTTAGFLMAARDAGHGLYGGIKLVCAKDEDPPADPARVEGGASVYRNHDADIWFDCSSVCLPVPLGYSYYTEKWDTGGNPDTRFAFAQTKLSFGDWQPLNFNNNKANRAESDGFLFASMHIGNLGPAALWSFCLAGSRWPGPLHTTIPTGITGLITRPCVCRCRRARILQSVSDRHGEIPR
jgi:hypothetical protein